MKMLDRWKMTENIKNFHQTIEIFHDFSPRNVPGATPHPSPNVHMTFLVDKIDMWRFPYALNYKPSKIFYYKDRLYIPTYLFHEMFFKLFKINILFLHTFFFSVWLYVEYMARYGYFVF